MVLETFGERDRDRGRDRETRRETKRDRETHTQKETQKERVEQPWGWQIPFPSSSFKYLLNDTA